MTLTSDSTTTTLTASQHSLALPDDTELFYRAWLPENPTRAIFLFHRGHEHSNRFADLLDALASPDTALFAWDARGHGHSPGPRGYAPSFMTNVRDVDFFVRHVCKQHHIPLTNIIALGHSLAAVALAAWAHDFAPPIKGLVLVTPAFKVKLYVPGALPGLRLLQKIKGRRPAFIKSYVKPSMLTHDPVHAASYRNDPLIAKSIAVNILLDLHKVSARILEDAAAIEIPTLLLSAGKDWVVHNTPQKQFFDRLSSPIKKFRTFPGQHHDLLHEKDRTPILDEIRTFIDTAFNTPPHAPINTDTTGYTRAEYLRLQQPAPPLRNLNFALQRLSLKTLGQLSEGIRLGWKTGFNSGPMLEYVYKNQPRGFSPLGRAIDKTFLNAIGWRNIRHRKTYLQELLRWAVLKRQARHQPVHVVDVAAGAGRYLIETFQGLDKVGLSALLRDADPAALELAKTHAHFHGLDDILSTQPANAFDELSLASLNPAPAIAIISGLFELFPDNATILPTLRGLATAMQKDGGILLYTNQPTHPQLEMIARVLTGPNKKPWTMRRRTQHEIDSLVTAAGFTKCDQHIDDDGLFTVSAATIGDPT